MTRSKDEQAQSYWTTVRLGYDPEDLSVVSRSIKIDPERPPYSMISVNEIPLDVELELLVSRSDRTWMKIRVFVQGNQISYLAYRTNGQSDMLDGLAAIRQQYLDSGLVNPPVQESLNSFSGKFMRIFKLPELTDWDKSRAMEWLEAQNTPGTAINLMHIRALENTTNYASWIPVWLRLDRNHFKQGPISIAHIQRMSDEAEGARSSMPRTQDTSGLIVGRGSAGTPYRQPLHWWERLFGRRV